MLKSPLIFLALVAFSAVSAAQTNADASLAFTQNGSLFTYDITLHNSGTTNLGTLWYAWIPGEDYLPIAPTATSSPTGWTFTQTTSAGFGFGLRWRAPVAQELAPGASLNGFIFTTTTTPAELAGLSIFGSHPPVGTTFVYEHSFTGLTSSGGSATFVANPVPEPASMAVLGLGVLCFIRRRRKS